NRVGDSEDKHNPMDFALWKFKKDDAEPAWPSPWGEGRPGWHIECSAMIKKHLGDTIDIHGGGQDLVFPHHENEIAQSEGATGEPFVRYWMHNGFVNIDNEKMSKSLGNFFTVRDIAELFPYPVIRYFILTGHYRSPLNFSDKLLEAAQTSLQRITTCVKNLNFTIDSRKIESTETKAIDLSDEAKLLHDGIATAKEHFIAAMSDDLNTSDALAAIFDLVRLANSVIADPHIPVDLLEQTKDRLVELCGVLGLEVEEEEDAIPEKILALVEERTLAKAAKDYAKADQIRDAVLAHGYRIEDTAEGPRVMKE
ncbi:MAG TPA: class I tRNA ligase family protein, partial [Clostridiaceae bacterium]|nr:class I tRNA ligase family protein [Clostridiaceae bacterium]